MMCVGLAYSLCERQSHRATSLAMGTSCAAGGGVMMVQGEVVVSQGNTQSTMSSSIQSRIMRTPTPHRVFHREHLALPDLTLR